MKGDTDTQGVDGTVPKRESDAKHEVKSCACPYCGRWFPDTKQLQTHRELEVYANKTPEQADRLRFHKDVRANSKRLRELAKPTNKGVEE